MEIRCLPHVYATTRSLIQDEQAGIEKKIYLSLPGIPGRIGHK